MQELEDTLFWGENNIILWGGFQAWSLRPSESGNVRVPLLECLDAVAWVRGRGVLIF
jgi:hypothetical protein